MRRTYIAIDLKSFYASVECVERGLDPMTTNLVVADVSRTEKTICLAVSPSLKGYGISGRARLFEVVQKVAAVNEQRQQAYPQHRLYVREYDDRLIRSDPSLALDYIVAPPRMAYYMEISTKIYQIYLRYVAPEDIHVYSIDEVFIDATNYLPLYGLNARGFARKLMAAVLQETGITATAGVGPNLFLCKVAMDVGAKHIKPDKNGARIAELDERSFREKLWSHRPLTDFWRVGKGYAKKLEANRKSVRSDVDFVLTFEELQGMFDAKDIDFATLEADPADGLEEGSGFGRGFAVGGGVAAAVVEAVRHIDPSREVPVEYGDGLRECRKMLMLAKAGKMNGCMIEGMGCPGGCIAGAGTILPIPKAKQEIEKIKKASTKQLPPKELREIELN